MPPPTPEERAAHVRANWRGYAIFFAVVAAFGLWRGNLIALAGAGIGFLWLLWTMKFRPPPDAKR